MQGKFSGQVLFFRASSSCSKFWRIKYTFNSVNSGLTLFFSASTSCLNILNVKSILIIAKNFMTNFVFRASASSSKIMRDENISMQWKIFKANSIIQGMRKLFKILNDWKYISNPVNSGHTLFFRASHQLLKSPER